MHERGEWWPCAAYACRGSIPSSENGCGTTLTTVYSLGETVNLVRLLPLPDKGMAIGYKLVKSIRALLLSPFFKTSLPPLPPQVFSLFHIYILPNWFQPISWPEMPFILKYIALNTIHQHMPLFWTPDCLLTCPTAHSWYFHMDSPLTHPNQTPNPSKLALSCSLFHL